MSPAKLSCENKLEIGKLENKLCILKAHFHFYGGLKFTWSLHILTGLIFCFFIAVGGAIASMKLKNILKRKKIKSFNKYCYNGFGFHYAVY